jgi:hypothetical protein
MSEVIERPNGKPYRPRRITANAVTDEDELLAGVMVLGTHDPGRAQPLADGYAVWRLGSGHVAVDPVTGWWRNGYSSGRLCWVTDEEHGRAGVWFREVVETSTATRPPT